MPIPQPVDLTSISRRLTALEREIEGMRGQRRLASAAISSGGLLVQDGGSIRVVGGGDITVEDGGDVALRGSGAQLLFNTETLVGENDGELFPFVSGSGRAAVRLTPPNTLGGDQPRVLVEGLTDAQPEGLASMRNPAGQVVIEAGSIGWLLGDTAIVQADGAGEAILRATGVTNSARVESSGGTAILRAASGNVDIDADGGGSIFVSTSSGQIHLTTNDGEHMFLNSAGDVSINTGGGDGNVFIDHPVDTGTANAGWNGTVIREVTSAARFKVDVEDLHVNPADALKLRPRVWRDRGDVERDPDTDRWHAGFVAEEVDAAGLGVFVDYDDDGDPKSVAYDRLSIALLEVVKDLAARVGHLESGNPAVRAASQVVTTVKPKRRPQHVPRPEPKTRPTVDRLRPQRPQEA